MPGPGSKKATKTKNRTGTSISSSSSTSLIPDSYVGELDGTVGWNQIVYILCDFYKLPDLTSRSGLKKVHSNFDTISRRLDAAYKKHGSNVKVTGGIVGIYAKMCADSILRDKLFERGFLSKLLPLLDISISRHMALQSLSSVAHYGSDKVHMELVKLAPVLIRLMNDFPDDTKISELSIAILSHSLNTVQYKIDITLRNQPQATLLKSLDIPGILKAVTEQMKKPQASDYLVAHGATLISTAGFHFSDILLANPSTVNFLIAGLRSKRWEFRCTCLSGLIRLYRLKAEPDIQTFDHRVLLNAVSKRFPDHISDLMIDYGPERCETFLTVKTSGDFQKALMGVGQNHDMYKFGLALHELILRTEFSIGDGYFESENPKTGVWEKMDLGLPFIDYPDALPHCAKAIRAKGKADEADKADILDIKYFIMKRRVPEAAELGKNSLNRNPECAYFHYAISLSADPVVGLRSAKKGMKCKQITPFLKFQLMQRAVEHAGELGLKKLEEAYGAEDHKWEEGIAFLMSAWEDSKVYVADAPPDNRNMKNVLYWNILLTILIQGPDITPDLRKVQSSIRKLKFADDLSNFLSLPTPKTEMRLVEQTVVGSFAAAVQEWGNVISTIDTEGEDQPQVEHEKAEDDLALWLDELTLDDGEPDVHSHSHKTSHPNVTVNRVDLYHCSWCKNPSAVLKKCSRCAVTRYCDIGCQKSHWPEHKKKCKTDVN